MDLITPQWGKPDGELTHFSMKPGEEITLGLQLYNCGIECRKTSPMDQQYAGDVPMLIGVFWDDQMKETFSYNLPANAPDKITLPVKLKAPTEAGNHQLSLVAFTLPGYSQFELNSLERTILPRAIFSHRNTVDVK
jgi:hypothetical protein